MGLSINLSCEAGSLSRCRPNPHGRFQRFEALFPRAGALGCAVCFTPRHLSVYLCMNVGPQGLPVVRLPVLFVAHSTSLGAATATRVLSAQVPVSAPPTGLDECFLFSYLVLDFLAVRFSVSSGYFLFLNCCCPSFGCARRSMCLSTPPSWPELQG